MADGHLLVGTAFHVNERPTSSQMTSDNDSTQPFCGALENISALLNSSPSDLDRSNVAHPRAEYNSDPPGGALDPNLLSTRWTLRLTPGATSNVDFRVP
ncbi:hypothetical protein BIW11_03660 [Tropilaelaps mercedesae]|uniref:Uncharacterized protein n=1 Tax=Tropilaelaps mercedesae TaxID=418985 RepID=A0A1V9XI54_9ACAR|nr:hypothetical protein BIW11_03660 [Tropilaelaps mercedesae]